MDFKQVDKKYRPIPFWSWNEKLDPKETARQVGIMDEAGIGGYFMHARGGLLTEYMGQEWFDNVRAATDEGARRGMHSWAYDENGWPSGFGGGKVNGLGVEYQQKSLHISDAKEGDEALPETVLVKNGKRYYYTVNEFYVDVLDRKVIAKFIEEIYEEYYRRCGSDFDGFFTDEPQILRGTGFPWSFILEQEFTAKYGYSLIENLDALFLEQDNSARVRLDYWQLVTELFSTSFFKQIHDWCVEHNYGFTGHLVIEESLFGQLITNGSCMAHYEYFTIPGMDWLGRPLYECLTPMQVGSVAQQMGQKQVLSETFALAGHNVSHNELKRIYEWQMVHGINLLCTHLEGYSLRGIRKRDYPPAMYYQQPWWQDMRIFFDSVSRIGMLLAEGEPTVDTLLIHPQTTAWRLYDGIELSTASRDEIMRYNNLLLKDMRALEDKHICYHLGDETVMRRHAYVKDGKLVVGKMCYSTVVIPENLGFLPYTDELLAEFVKQGGRIMRPEELPANPVTAPNRLTYTCRCFDGFTLHYFVNTDNAPLTADFTVGNKVLLPESGETVPFCGTHTFAPYESLVLIDDGGERVEKKADNATRLSLGGEWMVKSFTENSLTLDSCDYYFDGELVEKDGYVLNILPRINEKERPVKLHQDYRFTCEYLAPDACLVTETPDLFEITVNGTPVEKTDLGYFRDTAFRRIPIAKHLKLGENVISFDSTVCQSEKTYRHLANSWKFESMKNCLSYDVEIEPIYVTGSFGLRLPEQVEELDRDAYKIYSIPVVCPPPATVNAETLDKDGFSQFSGTLVLEKELETDSTELYCELVGRGMNSVSLAVNGKRVGTKLFAPYRTELSDVLNKGKNILTLTVVNNLRNMMGPHHHKDGECYNVGPYSFFKESNVFCHPAGVSGDCHDLLPLWSEGYCFVHFGIK